MGGRRAGYPRIGGPAFEQERAEDVAVSIDDALDVAAEVSAPLQPLVEDVDHLRHMRRIDAVVDLEALRVGDAHRAQLFVQSPAHDEHRDSVPTVAQLNRRTQPDQNGQSPWRDRGCQYASIKVVADTLKKK